MVQVPEWAVVLFVVATLIGIILQAGVLLGLLLAARAAMKRVDQVTEMAQQHVVPLLVTARRMAEENSPNVKTIIANVKETTDNVTVAAKKHVEPTFASVRRIVDENSPNVKVIVGNVTETSHKVVDIAQKLKDESSHIGETLDALLKKTEHQADRVDEMVTGTLNTISHATATLQRAVTVPVRQVGAMINGIRAGFGKLRNHNHHSNGVGVVDECDPYV
jgi:methyl-accepting chemotaxis protein